LEQDCQASESEYIDALSAVYHRISTRFAAGKNVDLERARCALEEHRSVCMSALADQACRPEDTGLGFSIAINARVRATQSALAVNRNAGRAPFSQTSRS
jgi:hypothetical protein